MCVTKLELVGKQKGGMSVGKDNKILIKTFGPLNLVVTSNGVVFLLLFIRVDMCVMFVHC